MYMASIYDTMLRQEQKHELGMRGSGTPHRVGIQAPEMQSPIQRTMNPSQLGEMTKIIRNAVVTYFCRDVVALRRKSEAAKSLFSEDASVQLMDILRTSSSTSSNFIDLITETCHPAKDFKEVTLKMKNYLCQLEIFHV